MEKISPEKPRMREIPAEAGESYAELVRDPERARELDPYGIDTNPRDVERARDLFPGQENHFSPASLRDFLESYPDSFPPEFDFVYWSIWDNYDPEKEEIEGLLARVKPGGSLVIGSYPNDEEQLEIDRKKIAKIEG